MKFFLYFSISVTLFVVCMGAPVVPFTYPLFHQCDPLWGSNIMGVVGKDNITICEQGCAMSCVSMALAGHRIVDPLNPAIMNDWLRKNGGYTCEGGDCANLELGRVPFIDPSGDLKYLGEKEKPPSDEMISLLKQTTEVLIAHVRNNHHFVLVVGWDDDEKDKFYVHDPFYSQKTYLYDAITDVIRYSVE